MKVLIHDRPFSRFTPKVNPKYKENAKYWREQVEKMAGEWIDVHTDCLYSREVAVIDPNGQELRIPMEIVLRIEDEARFGAAHCYCCRTWFLNVPDDALTFSAGCHACEVGELYRMNSIIVGPMGIPYDRQFMEAMEPLV